MITTFTSPFPEDEYPPMEIRLIEFDTPKEYIKGWGKEVWIANNAKYCGKLLVFNKGARFSLHYHRVKEESFYLLSGDMLFESVDLSNGEKKESTTRPKGPGLQAI